MAGSLPVRIDRTQRRKLRALLIDAWRNVPMYRSLYASAGLSERDLGDVSVLRSLPVLDKARLVAVPEPERINRRFNLSKLTRETTTGSTGQPFALYIDARYKAKRNLRFLHGLLSAGYRPWQRLLMLTDRSPGLTRRYNRHYQSVEAPTAEILDAWLRIRPHVLYGFTTPLRLLAETIAGSGPEASRPRLVVSTAEMLDARTRHMLETAFRCPVLDFYGMTEMGLAAWQRRGVDGYIMSRSVLTEFVPDDSCQGRYRMLMTNLDLRASPLIRFDSGDLAVADEIDGEMQVTAFEGRAIDTLVCRDGSELSPYRITDALRDVAGLRRFKVTQRDLTRLDLDLETDSGARKHAAERARAILENLLGTDLELRFSFSDSLVAEGSRKFRPVESKVLRT